MDDYSMYVPNVTFEQIPIKNLVKRRALILSGSSGVSKKSLADSYRPGSRQL